MIGFEAIDAGMAFRVDATLAEAFDTACARWDASGNTERLFARDATLWTGGDEAAWLGWLDPPSSVLIDALAQFAEATRRSGFAHTLLLGMGGSSLAPEVLARVFGPARGFPRLTVLDSTDPAQIRRVGAAVDLPHALIIAASKSGGTVETNLLLRHALARVHRVGAQVYAITDPGSSLEALARERGFADVFHGDVSIGGRFSALSAFGLVPAAALGLDLQRLLESAAAMRERCRTRPARSNPGVALGILIATLATAGRDKLCFAASRSLAAFPAWIEQLIAESLGKRGRGVVPLEAESQALDHAAADRAFVSLRFASEPRPEIAGIDIALEDRSVLAGEFLRWEVATAVAGALLGVNPFDQPDVEAAKVAARTLLAAGEGVASRGDTIPVGAPDLRETLERHLASVQSGDYLAILAFLDREEAIERALAGLRARLHATRRVATTLGFGPRYLHSTGQLHKGGPNRGVFLFITCDEANDLPVPGERTSFGQVKLAQACGDINVLVERGRRVLRVHLGTDARAGLRTLAEALR